MKKQKVRQSYEEAELDIVMLSGNDIIATSGTIDSDDTYWGGVRGW